MIGLDKPVEKLAKLVAKANKFANSSTFRSKIKKQPCIFEVIMPGDVSKCHNSQLTSEMMINHGMTKKRADKFSKIVNDVVDETMSIYKSDALREEELYKISLISIIDGIVYEDGLNLQVFAGKFNHMIMFLRSRLEIIRYAAFMTCINLRFSDEKSRSILVDLSENYSKRKTINDYMSLRSVLKSSASRINISASIKSIVDGLLEWMLYCRCEPDLLYQSVIEIVGQWLEEVGCMEENLEPAIQDLFGRLCGLLDWVRDYEYSDLSSLMEA